MTNRIKTDEFCSALRSLGVDKADVLVITSDLAAFGRLESEIDDLSDDVARYLECIRSVMPPHCTLVVPTFTYVRGGEGQPYHHESSPSETGTLTEFLRRLDGSVRSIHPVFSYAALGPLSEEICANTSGHSYGWNSPPQRLVDRDALVLCLGRSPHRGSFFIHFAEVVAAVPYRYTKQLPIPVFVNGEEQKQNYFHFVKYADSDIEWDTNRLVERLECQGLLRYEPLGETGVWTYRAKDIVETTVKLLMRNTYGLLRHVPLRQPWND